MRFESIKVKGLGPFREEQFVDLTKIDGRLIALTGENGAGKSTLLELLPGALYRTCPTRGSLKDLATERNAYVEVVAVGRQRLRIKQLVDAVSGKGESAVVDESGASLIASGKNRAFDDWRASHLPPPELVLSGIFGAQGSTGFLGMKPSERKGVLLRAIGVEGLETLAAHAREHAKASQNDVAATMRSIAEESSRSDSSVAIAEVGLVAAERHALEGETARDRARVVLADAEASAADAAEALRAWNRARVESRELYERADVLDKKVADLTERAENNRKVIADRERIDAAVAELERAQAALTEARVEMGRRDAEYAAAKKRLDDIRVEKAGIERTLRGLVDRARRAELVLARKAEVDEAVSALEQLGIDVGTKTYALDHISRIVDSLAAEGLKTADARIFDLRTGLSHIADASDEDVASFAWRKARSTLDEDDGAAAAATTLPARRDAARKDRDAAASALEEARRKLTKAQQTAALAAGIESAQFELDEAKAETTTQKAHLEVLEEESKKAEEANDEHFRARAEQLALVDQLEKRIAVAKPVADLAAPLAKAESRLAELEPQLEETQREAAEVRARAVATDPGDVTQATPDLDLLRASLKKAEEEHQRRVAEIGAARSTLDAERERAKRMAELAGVRARQEAEAADWKLLADSLGRDGMQALEIDTAGPELTSMVNDLLHTCIGPRFTITIEASKLSSDGKRTLDGCEVTVLDTEKGREGPGETFSGGERVILGEAVSLALAMLACKRSGIEGPTLVRDESGAALDPEKGRAYLQMLRRAADIVGASQVLFVTHSPELAEMADARIVVENGKVRVAG